MHAPAGRFRRAFMGQLLLGLQAAGDVSKSMGLRERRDAVRVTSDVAMASARGRAEAEVPAWARALVARHAAEPRNEALMRRILGGAGYERAAVAAAGGSGKGARSRKIVRRSHGVVCSSRRMRRSGSSGSMAATAATASRRHGGEVAAARRMLKGRLQLLRKLVPGGEAMHGFALLSEALDYVSCLKTQVEFMQCLCKGSQLG